MYTDILEDICDGSQSDLNVNRREACYRRRDIIKHRQSDRREALKTTRNIGKNVHKVFRTIVKKYFAKFTTFG